MKAACIISFVCLVFFGCDAAPSPTQKNEQTELTEKLSGEDFWNIWDSTTKAINKAIADVSETTKQVGNAIQESAKIVTDPLSEAVNKAVDGAVDLSKKAGNTVKEAVGIVTDPLSEAVKKAVDGAVDLSKQAENTVKEAVGIVTEPEFVTQFHCGVVTIVTVGQLDCKSAVDLSKKAGNIVKEAVGTVTDPLSEAVKKAVDGAVDLSKQAENTVKEAVGIVTDPEFVTQFHCRVVTIVTVGQLDCKSAVSGAEP